MVFVKVVDATSGMVLFSQECGDIAMSTNSNSNVFTVTANVPSTADDNK